MAKTEKVTSESATAEEAAEIARAGNSLSTHGVDSSWPKIRRISGELLFDYEDYYKWAKRVKSAEMVLAELLAMEQCAEKRIRVLELNDMLKEKEKEYMKCKDDEATLGWCWTPVFEEVECQYLGIETADRRLREILAKKKKLEVVISGYKKELSDMAEAEKIVSDANIDKQMEEKFKLEKCKKDVEQQRDRLRMLEGRLSIKMNIIDVKMTNLASRMKLFKEKWAIFLDDGDMAALTYILEFIEDGVFGESFELKFTLGSSAKTNTGFIQRKIRELSKNDLPLVDSLHLYRLDSSGKFHVLSGEEMRALDFKH